MREILFRGKRIDNGEWVEGFYSRSPKGNTYITTIGAQGCAKPEKVAPDTICQYTGLTDKNGKKIWEGDILQANGNKEELYQVRFGEFGVIDMNTGDIMDNAVGWCLKTIPTKDPLSRTEPFCYDFPLNTLWINKCQLEVIDNPDLLPTSSTDSD